MSFDSTTSALVLATSADPLMHGPLAVVRSLGRLGVPVYAAHPGERLPMDASRYLAGRTLLTVDPDANRTIGQVIAALRRIGGSPVLIPVDDTAALLVDRHAQELSPYARFPKRPDGLAARLADKGELTRICRERGMPTPRCWLVNSRAELRACATRFPVVVKAVDPVLLRRSPHGRSVTVARSLQEAFVAFDALLGGGSQNVLVQEYIPGGPESIWMFNAYFDGHSVCRFAATGVKLRQCPAGTGPTSLGVIRANDEVQETAQELLRAVGYTGIVDLGFRYDARDRSYRLLDVNPRIGGTFRLFTGCGGLDVARALYLDLTGQDIPGDAAEGGRCWQDEPHDLLAQATYHRQGAAPWREWLATARRVDERAWHAVDDRRPFYRMWPHLVRRIGRGLSQVKAAGSSSVEPTVPPDPGPLLLRAAPATSPVSARWSRREAL